MAAMMLSLFACDIPATNPEITTLGEEQTTKEETTIATDLETTTSEETTTEEQTTTIKETTTVEETTTKETTTIEETTTVEETTTEETTTEETTTEETTTIKETTTEAYTGPADERDVAKIILIGGQSNAEGCAYSDFLAGVFGEEKANEYFNGYDSVRALTRKGGVGAVRSRGVAVNTTVKISAPAVNPTSPADSFGPEVGLAEYLATNYPDETFYIVKYAIGGSCLDTEWFVGKDGAENGIYLRALEIKIENAIRYIDDELDMKPEIIAFCWMQGESDANTARVSRYYDNQLALINYLRDKYAYYSPKGGMAFVDAGISDTRHNVSGDEYGKPSGTYYWPEYNQINTIKKAISQLSSRNYYFDTIEAGMSTYEDNTDYAHYGVRSMILLGKLFGECIGDVLDGYEKNRRPFEEKPVFETAPENDDGPALTFGVSELSSVMKSTNKYIVSRKNDGENGESYLKILFTGTSDNITCLANYRWGARYLVIKYRASKTFTGYLFPNSDRETAEGSEQMALTLPGGDGETWQYAYIDLNDSDVFKDCGPYLSFFGFRIDNEEKGDNLSIAYMSLYSYDPQQPTE
jgi:hypothetical protein